MAGTCDGSPGKADIVCISLIHQIMKIQGKEIVADEGMLIRRIGQGSGYTRCLLLSGETEKDFEEAESFPEDETVPYEEQVVALIRERYSADDELALLRQRDTKPEEFEQYFNYCEECKSTIKQKLGMV